MSRPIAKGVVENMEGKEAVATSSRNGKAGQELTPEKLRELLKEGNRLRKAFRSQYEPARATGAEEMRFVYR